MLSMILGVLLLLVIVCILGCFAFMSYLIYTGQW